MSELLPSPWHGLFYSPTFVPREQFSVSQIEKAFGSAHEPDRGCLRSWAYRYLAGLKEPEYTYEEACQLPEHTPELAKLKGGIKKKTFGKVFHAIAERYYRGEPIDLSEDAANRFFSGSHLAPHPSQCVEIEIEKPIRVRTGPEGDTVTWSGFKDLVVRLPSSPRYLFDWKTTTPTVDNRRNRSLGKPDGAWTWQKDAKAIRIDYQANLYAYDELVNYGALPRGRWIYFANSGKPDARATDYEPDHALVLETVRTLDQKARILREHIRQFRSVRSPVLEGNVETVGTHIEPNLANCAAFGGCPYRSSVGGPCTAEQSGVIPIGSLLKTVTRPEVKPREIGPSFTFEIGAHNTMGLREEIEAAKQQRTQQPPPASGFVPQGQPPHVPGYSSNVGAPIPTAGMPPVFAAPTVPNTPAAPFDPSFAFGQQAPAAPPAPQGAPWSPPAPPAPEPPPAPPQAAPAPAPRPGIPPLGTATQNPEWVCDGNGGYLSKRDYEAQQAASAPPAQEHFPSHVNPPEAAAPIPEAPKKRGPGRPKKAISTTDPEAMSALIENEREKAGYTSAPTPSDFEGPELTVTLKLGRMVVSVDAPAELKETLQAYVLKAVGG